MGSYLKKKIQALEKQVAPLHTNNPKGNETAAESALNFFVAFKFIKRQVIFSP